MSRQIELKGSPNDLMRLRMFVQRYSDLVTEGGVRWAIFHRGTNGLERSGAIVKGLNGRWLVSPERYRAWLAGGA